MWPGARVSAVASVCLVLTAPWAAAPSGAPAGAQQPSAAAAHPAAATGDDVARYVESRREALHLPGVAVVVLRDDEPLLSRGFGEAAPGGPPVTVDTPFLLGSTSKQLTGLMVQQLVLDGRLGADTAVHQILPWFGTGTDPLSQVTVRQLLTHSSGLSTPAGRDQWGWRLTRPDSIEAAARAITESDLSATPGTRFEYSNSNYDVLGAVVEAVTREPYARALDELVARPLGLTSTTGDLGRPPPGLAAGYYVWFGGLPLVTPAPQVPGAVPSSMVVSTASDLTRVVRAHLGADPGGLGPALAAARTPLLRVNEYAQYASGWWVRPLWEQHAGNADPTAAELPSCVEHEGTTDRSMTYLLACPALGLGVVALANAGQGTDGSLWWRFHDGLVHATLGTAPAPYVPDVVDRYSTAILLGVPLLLALALAAQVRAVRRRRHVVAWSVPAVLLGIGALWLGYVYAPGRADGGPVHAMWSTAPDLAASTIVGTLLVAASVVVLGLALARGAARRGRRPAQSAGVTEPA